MRVISESALYIQHLVYHLRVPCMFYGVCQVYSAWFIWFILRSSCICEFRAVQQRPTQAQAFAARCAIPLSPTQTGSLGCVRACVRACVSACVRAGLRFTHGRVVGGSGSCLCGVKRRIQHVCISVELHELPNPTRATVHGLHRHDLQRGASTGAFMRSTEWGLAQAGRLAALRTRPACH